MTSNVSYGWLLRMQRRRRWLRASSFSNFSRLDFFVPDESLFFFFFLASSSGELNVVCWEFLRGVARTFIVVCQWDSTKSGFSSSKITKNETGNESINMSLEYERDLIVVADTCIYRRYIVASQRRASSPTFSIWACVWAALLILATWIVLINSNSRDLDPKK